MILFSAIGIRSVELWWQRRLQGGGILLFRPISWVYGAIVAIRNFLYDHRLLPVKKAPLPVVSIGNPMVGGTGKTPFVIALGEQLQSEMKVAILTRGYRSGAERRSEPLLVSRGTGPLCSWQEAGDEAVLMARRVPKAIVISSPNRYHAALLAKREGASLVLLDDGMQHRKLHRDLEIAMLDGERSTGALKLFPEGCLREPLQSLQRADYVVTGKRPAWLEIKKCIETTLLPDQTDLKGATVALFCGIGNPARFQATVERLGAHVVDSLILPDHIAAKQSELELLSKRAKAQGATKLVCTEKDWIKLPPDLSVCLPIVPVHVSLQLTSGQAIWNDLLCQIRSIVK